MWSARQDAQPGDLVFQRWSGSRQLQPRGYHLRHRQMRAEWIAVHCSSGKNGVTVGEAYGASFRYIRQPSFYPTQEELAQMVSDGTTGK